jgi:ABC-type transporter MlaC component
MNMTKIYLAVIAALLASTIAYAAAPDPDDVSKKAQQEALKKTQSQKYHQHDKKVNATQTAAQTQARHGGPTATNVTVPQVNTSYTTPTKKTASSNKATKSKKN